LEPGDRARESERERESLGAQSSEIAIEIGSLRLRQSTCPERETETETKTETKTETETVTETEQRGEQAKRIDEERHRQRASERASEDR
jgi:hypothetical protein